MNPILYEETKKLLLAKREVNEEINRHLWLESEKAGKNIGFQAAAEDWLKRFAVVWMNYHMPNYKFEPTPTRITPSSVAVPSPKAVKTKRIRRRSARSYYP